MQRIPDIVRVMLVLLMVGAPVMASALPDLERGVAALDEGRLDDALTDLQPLALRGYLEAQVRLARLYAERGREDDLDRAIHWYWTAHARDPRRVRIELARVLLDKGDTTAELDGLLEAAQAGGTVV